MDTRRTLVYGGPVWDTSAALFRPDRMIVVEGDRISAIERSAELPKGETSSKLLDVQGAHILPGLIDCHFHLIGRSAAEVTTELITEGVVEGVMSARRTLEAGVTTVRDAGCRHQGIYALSRLIGSGKVKGPRAFVSGPNLTTTAAPAHWRNFFADGIDAFRSAVRQEWRAGATWIKLILDGRVLWYGNAVLAPGESPFNKVIRYVADDELRTVVSEAHALGVRTSGHSESIGSARAAVAAGLGCLEHGTNIDADLAHRMADSGVALVPTMWIYLAETQVAFHDIRPDQEEEFRTTVERDHQESFQNALQAGVLIGAGSDASDLVPAQDVLACELETFVKAGMGRTDAIQAATINGARILGQEQNLGSLDVGKWADIVAADGDPSEDIRAVARPVMVMKGGDVALDLLASRDEAARHWSQFSVPAVVRKP